MSLLSEESSLVSDVKYKQYVTAIDKVLRGFESSSEWADLISALVKLNKVLSAHIKYPLIPRRMLIGKRLAQCLHPELPSGVHMRALECYDVMFKCMGSSRLGEELFVYGAGLFPLLGSASMNVRSTLLALYETHLVPLAGRLRPALCGFLNGVLPGLEEGSDHFERTSTLLRRVSEVVEEMYFFSCMWQCVLANPSVRLPAMFLVLARFDKRAVLHDQKELLGNDMVTLVAALCACVADSRVLVQRFALELLLVAFPPHLSLLSREQRVSITTASLAVLLRRDVSLNRRLYGWLLGDEVEDSSLPPDSPLLQSSHPSHVSYFDVYSRQIVVDALTNCFKASLQTNDVRALRILVSLLDRVEVGAVVLDYAMVDVLRALYLGIHGDTDRGDAADSNKQQSEITRAANLLFSSLEPPFVWQHLQARYSEACRRVDLPSSVRGSIDESRGCAVADVGSGEPSVAECCQLMIFLLEMVSVETCVDVVTVWLPNLAVDVLQSLRVTLSEEKVAALSPSEFSCSLHTCCVLLNRAQPGVDALRKCTQQLDAVFTGLVCQCVLNDEEAPQRMLDLLQCTDMSVDCRHGSLHRLLQHRLQPNTDHQPCPVLPPADCQQSIEDKLIQCENTLLQVSSSSLEYVAAFENACRLLVLLSSCAGNAGRCEEVSVSEPPGWLRCLLAVACFVPADQCSLALIASGALLDLMALSGAASGAVLPLISAPALHWLVHDTLLVQLLTQRLWQLLQPRLSLLHLTAVRQLQLLLSLTSCRLVEGRLAVLMTGGEPLAATDHRLAALERFSVLWHLSRELSVDKLSGHVSFDRCLLLTLDCLRDAGQLQAAARAWLTHTLQRGDVVRVMEPLLLSLLQPDTARVPLRLLREQEPTSEPSALDDAVDLTSFASPTTATLPQQPVEPLKRGKFRRMLSPSPSFLSSSNNRSKSPLRSALAGPLQLFVNPVLAVASSSGRKGSSEKSRSSLLRRRPSLESLPSSSLSFPASSSDCVPLAPLTRCASSGALIVPGSSHDDVMVAASSVETIPKSVSKEDSDDISTSMRRLIYEMVDVAIDKSCLVSNHYSASVTTLSTLTLRPDELMRTSMPDRGLHPLQALLLLYRGVYDSRRVLYTLQTLRAVLEVDCRLVLCSLATARLSSPSTTASLPTATAPTLGRAHQIHMLLARHARSLAGDDFDGEVSGDSVSQYRNRMLLELVIQLCLRFICSYCAPDHLLSTAAGSDQLVGHQLLTNRHVQLLSAELLTLIASELVSVVGGSESTFSNYLTELLQQCQLQRTLLVCLLSSVMSANQQEAELESLVEQILHFNEPDSARLTSSFTDTLQVQLIRLTMAVIVLEEQISKQREDNCSPLETSGDTNTRSKLAATERFVSGVSVCAQPMFARALMSALRQQSSCHMHRHWLWLCTSALPFLRRSRPNLVVHVLLQLMECIEQTALLYAAAGERNGDQPAPPDHMLHLLESATVICHFCLLDPSALSTHTCSPGTSASQVLANLAGAFPLSALVSEPGDAVVSKMRSLLLGSLHRVLAGLVAAWQAVGVTRDRERWGWVLGAPRAVRRQVVDLLAPLAQEHGDAVILAAAMVWNGRRGRARSSRQLLSAPVPEQLHVPHLLHSLQVLSASSVVHAVRRVLRRYQNPPSTAPVQLVHVTSLLQLLLAYTQRHLSAQQVTDSWPALLQLLKEGVQLGTAPVLLLLLAILAEVCQRAPPLMQRRDVRDAQDVCSRLVEACAAVAGACLGSTTWLRRSLAVRTAPELSPPAEEVDGGEEVGNDVTDLWSRSNDRCQVSAADVQWSVHALRALADLLAPLLDLLYQSDEKERAVPLLSGLMYRVTPYLRHHGSANVPAHLACSRLLASLSEYQFSRRAWRREALELLLDPAFFSMDSRCLPHWRVVVDNLMTHDRTTFKELLGRAVVPSSSTLVLFSSRDLELEQRCMLLKRLAFVVYCSQLDQYQPYMPDIQERLKESLRVTPCSLSVQASVMLCFRVLLLRMSAHYTVWLWPTIVTELLQTLLSAERRLMDALEDSTSDSCPEVVDAPDGADSAAWVLLQLQACKLVQLCLTVPAHRLPQFQMYRWAFVGEGSVGAESGQFVPHVARLADLSNRLTAKLGDQPDAGAPKSQVLLQKEATACSDHHLLQHLCPVFSQLFQLGTRLSSVSESEVLADVEAGLEQDFLEPLQPGL